MATLPIIRRGLFSTHLMRFAVGLPIGITHHKSTDVDALDIFTTDILLPKKSKASKLCDTTPMAMKRDRSELLKKVSSKQQTVSDMKMWNQNEMDHYLIVSIDCEDRKTLIQMIEEMVDLKRLPSDAIILRVLCYLCDDQHDSMAIISRLIDLCQEKNVRVVTTFSFWSDRPASAANFQQSLIFLSKFSDAILHFGRICAIFIAISMEAKAL